MEFESALRELKTGARVFRSGWNGKNMYLRIQYPDEGSSNTLPYIWMKTVDDKRVPWVASQTDLLSFDWQIL